MIFTLSYYIFLIAFIYKICKKNSLKNKKANLIILIIFSLLLTMINVYCTLNSTKMGGDRLNYLYDFTNGRYSSFGLEKVFSLVKYFNKDFNFVLYFTTFINMFIIFLCYKYCDDFDYNSMLLLLTTNIVFFSFTALKQIYTVSFAYLFFVFQKIENRILKNVLSILSIIAACSFHSTGFLLIPIYLYYLLRNRYSNLIVIFIIFFLFILFPFFGNIMRIIANALIYVIPSFSLKVNEYFAIETVHVDEGSVFTFIKGLPFIIINIWSLIKRKELIKSIKDYDIYIFMSSLTSYIYLTSSISYWMARAPILLFFPNSVLFSILLKNERNVNNRIILKYVIIALSLFFTVRSVSLVFINFGGY